VSDQRDPQRDRQGRHDPRIARPGVSGGRALPRLSAGRGARQPAAAAWRHDRRDRYDDSAPQAIDDYDRRRDARHSIPREQHRSVAEFGEAAFYGWSEDKARQAAKAEGAAFPPYLRAHGFTFD
jgi:hypothetical protein